MWEQLSYSTKSIGVPWICYWPMLPKMGSAVSRAYAKEIFRIGRNFPKSDPIQLQPTFSEPIRYAFSC